MSAVVYIKLKILVGFVQSQRHKAEHILEDKKKWKNNSFRYEKSIWKTLLWVFHMPCFFFFLNEN